MFVLWKLSAGSPTSSRVSASCEVYRVVFPASQCHYDWQKYVKGTAYHDMEMETLGKVGYTLHSTGFDIHCMYRAGYTALLHCTLYGLEIHCSGLDLHCIQGWTFTLHCTVQGWIYIVQDWIHSTGLDIHTVQGWIHSTGLDTHYWVGYTVQDWIHSTGLDTQYRVRYTQGWKFALWFFVWIARFLEWKSNLLF